MRWEYAALNIETHQVGENSPAGGGGALWWSDDTWDRIKEMGEEGWELVHMVEARRLYRPSRIESVITAAGRNRVYALEEVYHITCIFKRQAP